MVVPYELDKIHIDSSEHTTIENQNAMDKLGQRNNGSKRGSSANQERSSDEVVQPNSVFDIASLILYGSKAAPIRLKIMLDRLFSVLKKDDVSRILAGFGWTSEDYARGYQIKPGNKLPMVEYHEEKIIIQQFLRFGETKLLAQDFLMQELRHNKVTTNDVPQVGGVCSASRNASPSINRHPPYNVSDRYTPPSRNSPLNSYIADLQHNRSDLSRVSSQNNNNNNNNSNSLNNNQQSINPMAAHILPIMTSQLKSFLERNQSLHSEAKGTQSIEQQTIMTEKVLEQMKRDMATPIDRSTPMTHAAMSHTSMSHSALSQLQTMRPFDFNHIGDTVGLPSKQSLANRLPATLSALMANGHVFPRARQDTSVVVGGGGEQALNFSTKDRTENAKVTRVVQKTPPMPTPAPTLNRSKPKSAKRNWISADHNRNLITTPPPPPQLPRSKMVATSKPISELPIGSYACVPGADLTSPSGKKRVLCTSCNKTFCDKGALKIHYSAVHLKEMHACTIDSCTMVFSSRRSRNRHSANPNPKLHMPQTRRRVNDISQKQDMTDDDPISPSTISYSIPTTSNLPSCDSTKQDNMPRIKATKRSIQNRHEEGELSNEAIFRGTDDCDDDHEVASIVTRNMMPIYSKYESRSKRKANTPTKYIEDDDDFEEGEIRNGEELTYKDEDDEDDEEEDDDEDDEEPCDLRGSKYAKYDTCSSSSSTDISDMETKEEDSLCCTQCGQVFASTPILMAHMQDDHPSVKYGTTSDELEPKLLDNGGGEDYYRSTKREDFNGDLVA